MLLDVVGVVVEENEEEEEEGDVEEVEEEEVEGQQQGKLDSANALVRSRLFDRDVKKSGMVLVLLLLSLLLSLLSSREAEEEDDDEEEEDEEEEEEEEEEDEDDIRNDEDGDRFPLDIDGCPLCGRSASSHKPELTDGDPARDWRDDYPSNAGSVFG